MPTYLTLSEVAVEAQRCFTVAGCPGVMDKLHINLNKRGFTTLGSASYNRRTDTYNLSLCKKIWESLPVDQRLDTIRHECAHIIDITRRGHSGHDNVWKLIAMTVGAKPERCAKTEHIGEAAQVIRAERIKRNGPPVPAHCRCSAITEVSAKVGENIAQGRGYSCRRCKTKIVLGKKPETVPVRVLGTPVTVPTPAPVVVAPVEPLPSIVEQATARCTKVGCTITPAGRERLQALVKTHQGQTMKVKIEVRSTGMPEAGTFEVEFPLTVR